MLSEIYRSIIILYYYEGLSTKGIADQLNIPEGTVTWRLSAGRKKLKKEFDDMNETALHPVRMSITGFHVSDVRPVITVKSFFEPGIRKRTVFSACI